MTKLELFLKAIEAGLHLKKAWVISAFSLISEAPDEWQKNPYPFRIVQTASGNFFVEKGGDGAPTLSKLLDAPPGQPIYKFKEPIQLKAGDVKNLDKDITTTVGNLFFNASTLVYAFGNKVPYMEGEIKADKVEEVIAPLLTDTPDVGAVREPGKLYVDEYIKFCDAVYHLTNYTQLCVWATTEKTITPPPGVVEYRNKLIEENKDRLHDPAVVAAIDAKLVAFDAEYLKGDPGENFLISGKSRNIVRKKLYLMVGAEPGLEGTVGVDLIQKSLNEGWDISKFPAMNNTLRAGSFNRGAETQLGGESVKWLLRASSNIAVTQDDCGSTLGKKVTITEANIPKLVGFTLVGKDKQVKIDSEEQVGKYLGKTVLVRSPMYCKLTKTDYCKTCVGDKLGTNETGLSLAVSAYGSAFLSLFLAAGHSKGLNLAKMDYTTAIT